MDKVLLKITDDIELMASHELPEWKIKEAISMLRDFIEKRNRIPMSNEGFIGAKNFFKFNIYYGQNERIILDYKIG